MTAPTVFVSAGEPSGDLHAAALVRALLADAPRAVVDAVGGPRLRAAGANIVVDNSELGAMGLVEAAGSLPAHLRARQTIRHRLRTRTFDVAVLVDYPGFHLALARDLQRRNIPVLYYIAPQLWAWGAWRMPRLARAIDRLAVVLPFEEAFFRRGGISADFVGHPLVRDGIPPDRALARTAVGVDPDRPVLALLPGSRAQDVARHWTLFRETARLVRARRPELQVVVAGSMNRAYPEAGDIPIVRAETAHVLRAADAALCKSGTATLEAALMGTPQVVAYRMHPVTFRIARRLARVPWVGLPSLIAGRQICPEFLQHRASPARLADALIPLLHRAGRPVRAQRVAYAEVRERLGPSGTARRLSDLARELAA